AFLLLITTGCWSQSIASTNASVNERAPTTDVGSAKNNEGSPDNKGETPGETTTKPPSHLPEPSYSPPPSSWRIAENGAVLTTCSSGSKNQIRGQAAILRLTLPVGASDGKPGVAELTAWALIEMSVGQQPPLRDMIERLGGKLTLRVGPSTTSFGIVVDSHRWAEAMGALLLAMQHAPQKGPDFDRLQGRVAQARRQNLSVGGLNSLIDRVTRMRGIAADSYIAQIEDLTPHEVQSFHAQAFSPKGSVIALHVPDVEISPLLDATEAMAKAWKIQKSVVPATDTSAPVTLATGLHWAPSTGRSQVAVILPFPQLGEDHDLGTMICLESFSMTGIGGRLGKLSNEAFSSRLHWDGDQRYLILSAVIEPEEVSPLWRNIQISLASFAQRPPQDDEVLDAALRVRLRVLAEYANPNLWIDATTARALSGKHAMDWGDDLSRLEHPETIATAQAGSVFAKWPVAMVVHGGTPPVNRDGIVIVENSTPAPQVGEVPTDLDASVAAAEPYLNLAMQAVGGKKILEGITGFQGEYIAKSPHGGAMHDQIWYAAPGNLRRVRRVLATTIETVVNAETSVERAGNETIPLGDKEKQRELEEVSRHPLLQLAAHARGETKYRLVSIRSAHGREMAVVELQDPRRARLRLHIDTQSGLVRASELHDWRSAATGRFRLDQFADYRSSGSLRVPFHVVTTVEEGISTLVTDWTRFIPGAPAQGSLGLGGNIR
ncbi:MAG: hypothetical protein QF412_00920, partial [Planctomycetota bacterium]|nr:hypothetical protein [Planctomycetota bacterium]